MPHDWREAFFFPQVGQDFVSPQTYSRHSQVLAYTWDGFDKHWQENKAQQGSAWHPNVRIKTEYDDKISHKCGYQMPDTHPIIETMIYVLTKKFMLCAHNINKQTNKLILRLIVIDSNLLSCV